MIVTNQYGLPENFIKAVTYDAHRKADYSVSDLINPPRLVHLTQRHQDEISVDASTLIWRLFGSAVHSVLERGQQDHQLTEEYLKTEIMGRTISGIPDLYELPHTITDWKITSVWSIVYESRQKKWEEQLNCYAYLYREHGFKVEELINWLILRDWSRSRAMSKKDYPQQPVFKIVPPVWNHALALKFMEEAVTRLIQCENVPDDQLPPCSDEDRWLKPTTYAVMKEGRKSAVRVFDTKQEAQNHLDGITKDKDKHSIQVRPGEATRCLYYCNARPFCKYALQTKGEQNE